MRRVILHLLAGAVGGFLIWLLVEPMNRLTPNSDVVDFVAQSWLGALLGMGIGAALGAAEGLDRGSNRQAGVYALGGAGVGLLGGFLGIRLGQAIYGPWSGFNTHLEAFGGAGTLTAFISNVAARTVGWACIGLFVGAAMGVLHFSPRRLKSGLAGGLLGGAVGGFAFEIVARVTGVPELSRAIGFACVGGGTGLGVSLAAQLARQAWVRVVMGRNEGRDYLLDKEVNTVGRDEMSDVPLFGDPAVGKQHAFIRRTQGVWFLQDAGNASGTLVNGHAVREHPLQEGDRIGVGRFLLEFHHKGGQHLPLPERDIAPIPALQTAPANVCAFCGATKNPLTGGCACSPLGAPQPAPAGGPLHAAKAPAWRPQLANPPGGSSAGVSGALRLIGIAGPGAGLRVEVSSPVTLGRDAGNTVTLQDPSVSRRHVTLTPSPGGMTLQDEGSSNGAFVNGARVTQATLHSGDEMRIGDSIFRVELSLG